MKQRINIIAVVVLLLFAVSCKKEIDAILPQITITQPHENAVFDVFDTITVQATISDESKLASILITLTNEQYSPVSGAVSITPEGKSMRINTTYVIDEYFLESGYYYLQISASDGTNTKYKRVRIYIHGVPKKLKYLVALTKPVLNSIQAFQIDSSFNYQSLLTHAGDYSASDVSGRYSQLYIAGHILGNLIAYNLNTKTAAWHVPSVPNPPSPYFKFAKYEKGTLYVSLVPSGEIRGYNSEGRHVFSAFATPGYYPVKTFIANEYLFCHARSIAGYERRLIVFYLESKTIKQYFSSSLDIEEVFAKDSDNIFLFGNENGQATMKLYSIAANNWWEPHAPPPGKLTGAAQVDANNYIIATETGIYWYQYTANSLTTLASLAGCQKLAFDALSNQVFVAQNNTVRIFSYPLGVAGASVAVPDSIIGLHLVYNKD